MDIKKIVETSKAQITKTDLEILLKILEPRNIRRIIDIGTYKGGSVETWVKAFLPERLVTIEIKPKDSDVIEYQNYNYLWERDSNDPKTLERVKELISDVDFLFIDGYHSYAVCRRDYEMYSPLVKKGGVIVFHDIDPLHYEIQVKPLWEELKQKHNYLEIKTDQYSTGMGVLFI